MLRAGKSINIKSNQFVNNQAMLISPIINLDGIVLRADRTVPTPIKDFLLSCGAVVNRIRYKQELFIRLTGNFTITEEAIHQFKENNIELINEQLDGLNEIPSSVVLHAEVQDKQASSNKQNLSFSIGSRPISLPMSSGMMSNSNLMMTNKSLSVNSSMFAGKRLVLLANEQCVGAEQKFLPRMKYSNIPVGVMSESIGIEGVTLSTETLNVESAIVQSGATMELFAQNINLCLDRNIDWVNNPHPETSLVRLTKNFRMV